MKSFKHRFNKWFVTRPALRFGLAVAGVFFGRYDPEYFWPGVSLLLLGALVHLWAKGCLRQNEVLVICGPYRFVRHPFYFSYLVIDISLCMMIADLYVATSYFLLWIAIYYFQARKEEKALLSLFGQEYSQYRKKVPAFLPVGIPAKGKEGQYFSWNNPNITRRSEIARLLRLAAFPPFFFLAYHFRENILQPERNVFYPGSDTNRFLLSFMFSLFFFSRLLDPAIRRKRRILPARLEIMPIKIGIQIAILAICLIFGTPLQTGSFVFIAAIMLATTAAVSAWIGHLKRACIPLMLGGSAIAVAWQMYWLAPLALFYYCACAVDDFLFSEKRNASVTN